MKIAFSTLGCPAWSWERILKEASELGYDGIEIRGIEQEMALHKCTPFLPDNIERSKRQLIEYGLEIICLDTSCVFHDPAKLEASIEEGKAAVDLAVKLGVPYIRVFGDAIPDKNAREETIAQVAQGWQAVCRHAEGTGVSVLIETHGDFSDSRTLLAVIEQVGSSALGVLWDINNPYKYGDGEPLGVTYERLGRYIKHAHIKDTQGAEMHSQITLVGEGDVPIRDCVRLLAEKGYEGWLSFEWEKRWVPSIEEPEVAFPHFIRYIKE
ncbi:sugar phosphate isomerase/epimerase family protein [Paenibacillus montanisoli]|uniref:Sugar phosphate isomerase/epimerase n=1 Tax=Paenibacillus montanisoli TaxID=2081970 RepID=A0A328TZK7_9BACL|nr:sugar phosphate isomerase/epimerase family protein [Paenibacillus montanisoli]RAP75978.1 sugar phosphate isomerase/epimerase [Paenibacillus montanisoli]